MPPPISIFHLTFHIHTCAQEIKRCCVGELDPHRYALPYLYEISGRIVLWKHGQGSSGGRRYCGYFTIESGARNSIDRDLHLASGMNMLELSLLIVGSDPYLRGIDKIEESLPRPGQAGRSVSPCAKCIRRKVQ